MTFTSAKKILVLTASILLFALPMSVNAVPVMEMRVDRLLLNTTELKKSLQLTPNQLTLWLQTEMKLNAMKRQRDIRRERLQSEVSLYLGKPQIELREVNKLIENEEQQSLHENRQMRELLFVFNDALDDRQRQVLLNFFAEQLMAQQESGRDGKQEGAFSRGHQAGGGRQRGGMGGVDGKF
ncbi:hypothetical protein ACO0LB_18515 [Undibacterium sp. SXout7W]|uniref:hypothetical protein n=1 Tax=Undibacterium sp. SXout7W TaxID=3413049 RepID=UPI003BF36441